jgi:hypothetical protein
MHNQEHNLNVSNPTLDDRKLVLKMRMDTCMPFKLGKINEEM